MKFKYFIEILKFSAKPLTIIYPLPILQFAVFSYSKHNLNSLFLALIFSFTFYPAVNIWNHVNDVKEDILGGKYNIFAEGVGLRIFGAILAILLYFVSFLIIVKHGNAISLILFIICFLTTWAYSDRIIFGRCLTRLKDHYVTELISFVVSYVSFTLLLWTFFEDLDARAIALSLTILFFVLFGIFIKDIKDISGDEKAGLKTLGVVFTPNILIKLAYISLFLYYLTILIFTLLGFYNILTILSTLPFVPTFIYAKSLKSKNWVITIETLPYFKRTLHMNMISIFLFVVTGLLSPT